MSSLAAQYTPLESLLLFQSLACLGVESHVFGRISDQLQNNKLIIQADSYDKDRLSPDALRDFYLGLLKDEIKHEQINANDAEAPIQNGDSPATRKRKAPSPSMPSVEEAVKHAHLLPQLIEKLYTRYRRQVVEDIREDERMYDILSRELEEFVRGERDGQLIRDREIKSAKEVPQNTPPVSNSPAASADVVTQDAPPPVKPTPQLSQSISSAASSTTPCLLSPSWAQTTGRYHASPLSSGSSGSKQQREQQAASQHTPRTARSPRAHVAAPTPARPPPAIHHPQPAQPMLPLPNPSTRPPFPIHRPPPLRLHTAVGSWKKTLPPLANGSPKENLAPVSPISPPSSPELPPATTPASATRSKRPVKSKEMPAPDVETPLPGRGTRKGGKRGARGASVASSTVTGSARGRTRSQSIASHAEEPSASVKPEPSTPAETIETDAQSTTEATPTSGGRRTRRRAGTLQSVAEQPTGTANNKRKRDQREESETPRPEVADEVNMASPAPPTFVVASRNFSRMSAPVLNDISSHKHASLFSTPVKAKDAEGYYDIIRRPQDLKSIRAAIQNGSRAVTAATASNADTPLGNSPSQGPSTPTHFSSSSTHITLPISEDLVPPKGIVNSAQLEKELMRMFANAVMFNSGADGVVKDAVEMATDVEASVANWRAAERPSALVDGPTSGVPEDGDGEGGGKRRKL
ncbi:Bromodomain-containing protein [Phyllosticta citricarpa]|uniref:Bromodomain-containing protein n=1 Tax=Phyllosticta citricarpa TaxID=55181 RepID=A0ABR1MR34_9PEZI